MGASEAGRRRERARGSGTSAGEVFRAATPDRFAGWLPGGLCPSAALGRNRRRARFAGISPELPGPRSGACGIAGHCPRPFYFRSGPCPGIDRAGSGTGRRTALARLGLRQPPDRPRPTGAFASSARRTHGAALPRGCRSGGSRRLAHRGLWFDPGRLFLAFAARPPHLCAGNALGPRAGRSPAVRPSRTGLPGNFADISSPPARRD